MEDSSMIERGSVNIDGHEYPAIRFKGTGIVHVKKHSRFERISKMYARTFMRNWKDEKNERSNV